MAKKQALGKGIDALLGGAARTIGAGEEGADFAEESVESAPHGGADPTPTAEKEERSVEQPVASSEPVVSAEPAVSAQVDPVAAPSAAAPSRSEPIAQAGTTALLVAIDSIDLNPGQPRMDFDMEALEALAESLKTYGLIQPITVRRIGDRYQLISGERRVRAARMAGIDRLPAYVREAEESTMREMALVENVQREDLSPIEVAQSLDHLMREFAYTQEQLAQRIGMARSNIANHLRLLRLPISVQSAIQKKLVTMGHAKVLMSTPDQALQEALCIKVQTLGLTVSDLEQELKRIQKEASEAHLEPKKKEPDPEVELYREDMERRLTEHLGWGVRVQSGQKGSGRVVISYRNEGERLELLRRFGLDE